MGQHLGKSSAIAKQARTHAFLRAVVQIAGAAGLVVIVALSAVVTKQVRSRSELQALVQLDGTFTRTGVSSSSPASQLVQPVSIRSGPEPSMVIEDPLVLDDLASPVADDTVSVAEAPLAGSEAELFHPETRWFNGRPVRPVKSIAMTVTAYTPDEISCGASADGITASLHSVWTNAMRLVAADSKVLPLGSMVTVPGYADNSIVPVLDR
ncbi:MAG: hypothetical protein H7210_02885, partial [Pyrinomonadaceae bacterium]|nr:hypothetical protein [Phycisphaerales bacterium]